MSFSSPTRKLGLTGLAIVSGVFIYIATRLSAANALAVLPAGGIFLTVLLLLPDAGQRLLAFVACIVVYASVSIAFNQSLLAALAIALANLTPMLVICPFIQSWRGSPDLAGARRDKARAGYFADQDFAAGLTGRALLLERIETMAAATSKRDEIAVLVADVDNFKYANDAFGPDVVDYVLGTVAGRLRCCVKDTDLVVRIGISEFAVLLGKGLQPLAAETVARRISDLMDTPITVGAREIRMGGRIGVAPWQAGVETASELLRRADVALHRTKTTQCEKYRFFDTEMDRRLQGRLELEQDLRKAFAEEEFDLHYQPIVRLATNEIIGLEALIRWSHATRGTVSPAEFIPIAEETGLIAPIGDWVLRRACRDAVHWPAHVKVSVNFSCAQFESSDVKHRLCTLPAETGFPLDRLQLEITETTVMADVGKANELLSAMRELGVEVAMDDFGTGYSSLSCLRGCPFDRLKIDRSFVEDLTTSLEARLIFATIVKLAKALGMHSTAEGVETAEQYEIVKAEGCSEMQGYYFSPAKSAAEVTAYFASRNGGVTTAA